MGVAEIILIATGALKLFTEAYNLAEKIKGEQSIPTPQEMLEQALAFQAKIDAEKEALKDT